MRLPTVLFIVSTFLAGCSAEGGSLLGATEEPAPSTSTSTTTSTTAAPSSATVSTTTSTTTTLPSLVVSFAGDTSFTHGLASYDPLGEVDGLLSAPDLTLVNLETTIAEADVGRAYAKKYTFKSPPESAALLAQSGIDGVALGNNHLLDYGEAALLRTLEVLDQAGVARAGAGENEAGAYAPMVFEAAGRRVAVLSFSRVLSQSSWAANENRPGVASAYEDRMPETLTAVADAASSADLVAVMVHWGVELNFCPEPYQRQAAAAWVEAGADLVVGSHPHVLQGVERIDDAWVVYSTGNFAFPSARGLSDDSAVFEFTVDGTGAALVAHPVHIINGRPHPPSDEQSAEILSLLSGHSFGFAFDGDGVAVPSEASSACD